MRKLDITSFEDFKEKIAENETVLVDFYAVWCGPCKMMGPVLEEVAAAHPTVKFGKLNTDENLKLAMARNCLLYTSPSPRDRG